MATRSKLKGPGISRQTVIKPDKKKSQTKKNKQ